MMPYLLTKHLRCGKIIMSVERILLYTALYGVRVLLDDKDEIRRCHCSKFRRTEHAGVELRVPTRGFILM